MILYDLTNSEQHPLYETMAIANNDRHYDFLRSIVLSSVSSNKRFLSHYLIQALNFHSIVCLHTSAGKYRPCEVSVNNHTPPRFYRVHDLMDDFINSVNVDFSSGSIDPVVLASFVLWRLNFIHPFINGNGRTARACAYYVLCLSARGWIPGTPILPELIKQNRTEYVMALEFADQTAKVGSLNLAPLHALLSRLLQQQLASTQIAANTPSTPSTPGSPA